MFSLICAWITGWVNNGEAGDLRRYRAHYDVTLMRVCDSNNNAEDVGLPFDLDTLRLRQYGRNFADGIL